MTEPDYEKYIADIFEEEILGENYEKRGEIMIPKMTLQEAINRIDLLIDNEKLFIKISTMGETSHNQNIEALEIAKLALEKQISQKVKKVKRTSCNIKTISEITKFNSYNPSNKKDVPEYKEYKYSDYLCPSCNALTKDGTPDYCWRCGQALDWSED